MFNKHIFRVPHGRRAASAALAFSLALGPASAAADPVEEARSVSGFDTLSASISGRISLSHGDEGLVIEAEPDTLERIVTEVEDGVLRIYEKSGSSWWRDSGPIHIRVSYQTLSGLQMSGSSDVTTDQLNAEAFDIGISGSSNIEIPSMRVEALRVRVSGSGDLEVAALTAGSVRIGVSGSGDVEMGGRTDSLTVTVNGSGNVDAADLSADIAEVSVSGSGDVDVRVESELNVRISGSGNVVYRGAPDVSSRISGSGDLKHR